MSSLSKQDFETVTPTSSEVREFYPLVEPFEEGFLKVDEVHNLYYEVSGNKAGKPILVVHGGPGGGCPAYYRQFFNPEVYNIVMFDQRGAGKSTPSACLIDNTTWHLVADIEKLRSHLKIENWVVFGGSWGSTLALSYACKHTERVKALVLRGIFTLRAHELHWFYQEGASYLFPDLWEQYLKPIPMAERHMLMNAFYRRLTGDDEKVKLECAQAWSIWEMATSKLFVDDKTIARARDDAAFSIAFSRIECHYFVHGGFFEYDGWLIDECQKKLSSIPTTIVQGRYDLVCPAKSAWDLYRVMPHSRFRMIADAGHSCSEKGTISELVKATDLYSTL